MGRMMDYGMNVSNYSTGKLCNIIEDFAQGNRAKQNTI